MDNPTVKYSKAFKVIDKVAFSKLKVLKIKSIYSHCVNVWNCSTSEGNPLVIKYGKGYLMIGHGETEYEANTDFSMVGIDDAMAAEAKLPDILEFMGWKVNEKNIWDN